jgi:LPXTG-site transpeptidase (sortase) family protein
MVTSITSVREAVEVYNISVDGPHNYFVYDGASSYLVHNKLQFGGTVYLNNSIITNSFLGFDCFAAGGGFVGTNNLIDDFASGDCSLISSASVTNFNGAMQMNGGPTPTHALLAGSNAIDAGNSDICAAEVGPPAYGAGGVDQRGVTRPSGACDIGAYELDDTGPQVASTSLQAVYKGNSPSTIKVIFNENVNNLGGGADAHDAQNPDNYVLVEEGSLAGFQTTSCDSTDFVNDTKVTITSVDYDSSTYKATLYLAGALGKGTYRLFVCGTATIRDPANNVLNGGLDHVLDFEVQEVLPDTGFTPGLVSFLPAQSAAYTSTGLVLEIPRLDLRTSIVGIPQAGGSWDVTWLGGNVGYLAGSAFPTWAGNTVLTGHVWDAYNRSGPFMQLKEMRYGDFIEIEAWGLTYIYEVRQNRLLFPGNTDAVFEHEDYDWVTLLTCEFYNPLSDNYIFRRVVRAVLVSVE